MTAHGRLLAHLLLARLRWNPEFPQQEVVATVLREELGHADPIDVQFILSALPCLDATTKLDSADLARFLSAQFFPNTANFQRTAHSFGPSGDPYYRKA
jgi:hypothetical protein